ncbi:MAG: response regulator [Candidatus Magasanikbacteria bacterium]|jgi:CheY-like chemotaxis protein|nr:response regulator [Candidatus Magasanikbacteria bacterium]
MDGELRVLIVDDDAPVLTSLERGFRSFVRKADGELVITAVRARDGKEALEQLTSSRFDIMITDVDMPTMNGIELLKRVFNGERDHIPPIIHAWTGGNHNRLQELENPANNCGAAYTHGVKEELVQRVRELANKAIAFKESKEKQEAA